jgi:hypothetical protein
MKKLIVGIILCAIGMAANVSAQTLTVDIAKAKLNWTWVPGAGSGVIADYEVRCGQTTKTYTKLTVVPATQTTLDVKTAITGNGNWFCVTAARNQFTPGGALVSNEVSFVAGAGLSGSLNLTIVAQ